MAGGAVAERDRRSGRSPYRPTLLRLGLVALSCLAAGVLSSWHASRLAPGARGLELVLCVLAWEAATSLCRAALGSRGRRQTETAPGLAALVLAASVPASAGMAAAFLLLGEPLAAPGALYGQSLLLGLVLAFARRGLVRSSGAEAPGPSAPAPAVAAPDAPPEGASAAMLLRRHAPHLVGRRLLALEAEDHYVRIHTDGGNALVLMRLRDAVAALGSGAGWQPHRSFWIAAGTQARAQRNGQGWSLTLAGGLVVPVSRANVARLREAGYPTEPAGRTAVTGCRPAPGAPAPPPAPPS